MWGTIASFVADLVVGIWKKIFTTNRDEEIGQLKVTNAENEKVINDIEKSNIARSDDTLLNRVHTEFTRKD